MGNMYGDSKSGVSNVFVGCEWECIYCKPSFQAQMKRQMPTVDKNGKKRGCQLCYEYKPHFHEERLKQSLPLTTGDEFIWLIRSGDPCFMESKDFQKVLDLIAYKPNRDFLIQTKNPKFLQDFKYSDNCILGITLETNRNIQYSKISEAPLPTLRAADFWKVEHPRKFITIEPIMDFDMNYLCNSIRDIKPERVYIGYNTKKSKLPEPTLQKTTYLIEALEILGIKVKTKLLRERYEY